MVAAERMVGGITATIWRLHLDGQASAVLRWVDAGSWGETGRQHVHREALGCRLMTGSVVPAPQLIGSDPEAAATGGFANLTTFLPGQVRLERLGPAAMAALAGVAVEVHRQPVAEADRPPVFAFWAPETPEVPTWTRRPELWRRALALYADPPGSTGAYGLIHRDFHPGNTLWLGDTVTGLIDWAETSWGPADLDVAHACSNFAMLHSVADAVAFEAAYVATGGRLDPDPAVRRFWAAADVVGFLPDPGPVLTALTERRPDLTVDAVRQRLEDLLAHVLGG